MNGSELDNNVILQVEDLHTHFQTRWGTVKAVDGVSFNLRRGETLGIVGESGSGKSVTMLSLMRLVPSPPGRIVSGKIVLDGEDVLELPAHEMTNVRGSKIALIIQDPMTSLNPVFSIGIQVSEAIRIHQDIPKKTILEKAIEVLRKVNIPAAESRVRDYPHQMSGGMRQRVVGAIGISCEPLVLIADEPTTSLDVTIQAQYLKLLKDLQEESGLSLIFVTHDFGIVAKDMRPGGGDVRWENCGDRKCAGHLQQSFPSVHRGPAGFGPQDGGRCGPALLYRGPASGIA